MEGAATMKEPLHQEGGERGAFLADEHRLPAAEVAARFGTSINEDDLAASSGLSTEQVLDKQTLHGPNLLTPPKEVPEVLKFLYQFTNPLMVVLLAAAMLTYGAFFLQGSSDYVYLVLATALVVVITLTCVMTYLQERSASNVMSSLRSMMPSRCLAIRAGREVLLEASELVPGDLVRLRLGDRVPADIRVIESQDLKVECSSLTGESDLVPATVVAQSDVPEQAHNLIFMSTMVMSGEGRGIVVRTGDETMIGKIAGLASDTHGERSTLMEEVHRLVCFIAILATTMAIIFFFLGIAHGHEPLEAFVNGFVLVLVANVPEGLPATVTSCLAMTAMRLKERKVLIKRTDIIENLGCASIIASDKTGTLTQNKMTAENVWCNCELHAAAVFLPEVPSGVSAALGAGGAGYAHGAMGDASNSSGATAAGVLLVTSRRKKVHVKKAKSEAAKQHRQRLLEEGVTYSTDVEAQEQEMVTLTSSEDGESAELEGIELTPLNMTAADSAQRMAAGRLTGMEGASREALLRDLTPDVVAALDAVTAHRRVSASGAASGPHPSALTEFAAGGHFNLRSFYVVSGHGQHTWHAASAFARMVAVATVCNKATFEEAAPHEASQSDGSAHVSLDVTSDLDAHPAHQQQQQHQQAPAMTLRQQHEAVERRVLGDATDTGLLRYCDRLVPSALVRRAYHTLHSIPFNSATKWAATVTECPGDPSQHLVMLKGAPEILITKCSRYLQNGREKPLDEEFESSMLAAYERCGFMGERVIGFAYQSIDARDPASYRKDGCGPPDNGFVFLGLLSLVDPPRHGVREAVATCRRAGVRVAMVTGDHPLTAEAIARKVGIVTLQTPREVAARLGVVEGKLSLAHPDVGAVVVTGARLRELRSDEEWDALLRFEELVFARTSPQQKLQIVEHLQRRGEIVAVTGDGVNDSPALKKAQIGVAMGLGGSDVAREAADIVLMDDEFPSIVMAIEEGRIIFDNLKKTIAYTLSHCTPEVFPVFLNLAFGFPLGLSGLMVLSIDLVTEQGPGISLAYEPAESAIMDRPPRNVRTDRLVSMQLMRYSYLIAGVMEAWICMVAFLWVFWSFGISTYDVAHALSQHHFTADPADAVPLQVGHYCFVNNDGEEQCAWLQTYDGYQQREIWRQAQGAWYATLVMCQFWNIWACKTRQASVFTHGVLRNPTTLYGCLFSIAVVIMVLYIPGFNSLMSAAALQGQAWLFQLVFAAWLMPWSEITKRQARYHPDGWWARHIAW